jgi:outer membrane protein TolC
MAWLATAIPAFSESPLSPDEPSQAWTLDAAIARALEHNLELARGALGVEAQSLEAARAREAVRNIRVTPLGAAETGEDSSLWRAGLEAAATLPWGTTLAAASTASQVELDGADPTRRAEVSVSVSQPLFRNFGSLVRDEPAVLAAESYRAARRAWERERSSLALEVAEAYESLVCRLRQLECDEAQARLLERLAALAEIRERRGRASRTEVLRLGLQRGEAESRIETDRAELAIGFESFANLLGLPPDTPFDLSPPPLLELDDPSPDRALALAVRERPDYAQALDDIASADRHARIARRALLPDLALTAKHVRYGEDAAWSDASRFDETDWRVGLEGRMNLDIREALLDSRKAGTEAEGRRRAAEIVLQRLALEVHSARTEYLRARRERELSGRNLALADRRAELARALFEAGRGTADAVSDAEADALSARLRELEAQRAAACSAYRLLHALGTLVPASPDLLADLPENPHDAPVEP